MSHFWIVLWCSQHFVPHSSYLFIGLLNYVHGNVFEFSNSFEIAHNLLKIWNFWQIRRVDLLL
jgi:hypothetical protein